MAASTIVEEINENASISSDTELPPLNDFLKLVENEQEESSQDNFGYSVYHKYYKSC